MHQNYFFLRQVAQELNQRIAGMEVGACFSQSKDELTIGLFHSKGEFWMKALMVNQVNALSFPGEFQRARQNTVDLFKSIIGKKVLSVKAFEHERAIAWALEQNQTLVFKLFGNHSNAILFEGEEVGELFKRHQDEKLTLAQLHHDIVWNKEVFMEKGLKAIPTLGKEVQQWLNERGWQTMDAEAQWAEIQALLQYLQKPNYYVVEDRAGLPQLTLLPTEEAVSMPSTALLACNDFFYRYAKIFYLAQEKQEALRRLQKQLKSAWSYIEKSTEKLNELRHGSRFEELGHLLMANLHHIKPHAEKVVVYDFYKNDEIEIKLNAQLSPQKNAENYYRKAKNQKIEIEKLEANIGDKEEEIEDLEAHIRMVSEAFTLKELRKYLKNNGLDSDSSAAPHFPFRRFEYEGFEIWVGKNAKNNDLLTQRYAFKEDLWMHARDVAGSHLIVKYQAGKTFPKPVIEKAASLAAYYSQRRTDTLCPVICTPKKYVRKPKGLEPGMVVVDKEEVVMIEPRPF